MELSELTAYAQEKYRIAEEHKWNDFPGFSVLCHPETGKWIALLMRQWDTERGEELQRCDMKCGREWLSVYQKPYLSVPVRMHGSGWIGIAFGRNTEEDIVFRLLDEAVSYGKRSGYTIVLGSELPASGSAYKETPLPFAGNVRRPGTGETPERIREMRHLYGYGPASARSRAENFYRQAAFMEDYTDTLPWSGDFVCYFPTYQEMNTRQLRGYFTWRAAVRKGNFQPIAASAAYIYLYELLNGVGASSPEDSLRKMEAFEAGYLDHGPGDERMRRNLRRWMMDFAVVNGLPPETARLYADPELLQNDRALAVLKDPSGRTDEELFSAFCRFGGGKTESSPVLSADPERGKRLFGSAFRKALSEDVFTRCFGPLTKRPWYPLSNAVYLQKKVPEDRDYVLDGCRSFRCRGGSWTQEAYESLNFDRKRLKGLLHETDARLRRYLKTGRYLKEAPEDAWAAPYAKAAIREEQMALAEAARPKIRIDLSSLDRIRTDADFTRESLLTDEEREDRVPEEASPVRKTEAAAQKETLFSGIPLGPLEAEIVLRLLSGKDAAGFIREHRLMPSIVADAVNEAFYDEIGDTVLLSDGEALALVDDYREDLLRLLGGNMDG